MPAYKGFNPMGPGDVKPWGTGDLNHEKDIIDTLVTDCVSSTKELTGHKHKSLYDPSGVKIITPTATEISIGDNAHDLKLSFRQGSTGFRMQQPGTNYDVISAFNNGGGDAGLTMRCPGTDSSKGIRFYSDGGIFTSVPADILSNIQGISSPTGYCKWWRIGRMIFIQMTVFGWRTQNYVRIPSPAVADGVLGSATAQILGGIIFQKYTLGGEGGTVYSLVGGAWHHYSDPYYIYISPDPLNFTQGWLDTGATQRIFGGVISYLCRNDQ